MKTTELSVGDHQKGGAKAEAVEDRIYPTLRRRRRSKVDSQS